MVTEPEGSITIGGMTFTPAQLRRLLGGSWGGAFLLQEAIASTALSHDETAQTHSVSSRVDEESSPKPRADEGADHYSGRWKDPQQRIAEHVRDAAAAQVKLLAALADACPGPHEYVQHRDHKPPWCRMCGYTSGGSRVREVDEPQIPRGRSC